MKSDLKIRPSLTELQDKYEQGNKAPLEMLMRAWKGIKSLRPDDPHSFFVLGGFHGEPFRGAGWGNNSYWGGYCNHGNVLFPTWHRVYLIKLEEALQQVPGCSEVMLPYWDETSETSIKNGIPWALTIEKFELDGEKIDNPLRSFVFPKSITDNINGDSPNYSKPKGYETVRYPLSGLVGTADDRAATEKHNAQFTDADRNVQLLNENIKNWLTSQITVNGQTIPTNVVQKFKDCLKAPNYTVFSNTTSAQEWNENMESAEEPVVALESPHNSIHLAVGGCDIPNYNRSPIPGANGDMGENDTAGLDPIFYFHHCNVDRMFWIWQKLHHCTDSLEIIPDYPGTNTVDAQGPTPGMVPNTWLDLTSPLNPFLKEENGKKRPYTSQDVINIERQLGMTYSKGSLDEEAPAYLGQSLYRSGNSTKTVKVSRLNRLPIRGSFMVSAFARLGEERYHLGTEAILSRWSVQFCANCQAHLEVKAFFGLHGMDKETAEKASIEIEVQGRDGQLAAPGVSETTQNKRLYHLRVE